MDETPSINVMEPSDEEPEPNLPSTRSPGTEDDQYLSADPTLAARSPSTKEQWPGFVREFYPIVLTQVEAWKDMREIEKNFSKRTNVRVISRLQGKDNGVQNMILDDQNSVEFRRLWKRSDFLACFINRFIMHPDVSDVPRDKKRLRISAKTFRWLLAGFDASPRFVSSIISTEILTSLECRSVPDKNGCPIFTCWYTLPVRTAVACFDEEGSHALSVAGSNQMDPNGYLHLGDIVHDIRPSKIAVYSRCDNKSCRMMFVDFQDGRLHELADEPFNRIREASSDSMGVEGAYKSLELHAIILSSSRRWWSHALTQMKKQLINCEVRLLDESVLILVSPELDLESSSQHLTIKKTLHSIMSHLQRYKTELQVTRTIAHDLQAASHSFNKDSQKPNSKEEPVASGKASNENLKIVAKQISALEAFVQELEAKTGTVMELLSQVVKSRNDMLLVNNGKLVQKLLKSARRQAKASQSMMRESHQMARDMRKDSVSMKTIALLTMAFLPATSFAAILSMPFFSQQEWLNDPARMWLWVVLTVPSTALAVFVYLLFTRKELKPRNQDNEEDEMESVDFVLED